MLCLSIIFMLFFASIVNKVNVNTYASAPYIPTASSEYTYRAIRLAFKKCPAS